MAAGGTINPLRQQMINMMYLVLLALLALNVSADILKAFALVNKGLDRTNVSYEEKNAISMAEFADLLKVNKGAAQKYYNNAVLAREESDRMFNYLQLLKEDIAARAGGWAEGSGKTTVVDDNNLETSTRFFLKEAHGKNLQDSLKSYISLLKGTLENPNDIPIKIDVNDPPPSKDGERKDWISYYWEGVPSVAAITELTKLQNDIRNVESDITNYNMNKVSKKKYIISDLEPVVSAETPVLSIGQNFNAKIFLGAISSSTVPKITVNGVPQKVVNGSAYFSEPANTGGVKELNIGITVPNPFKPGHDTTFTTKTAYTVFSGASTISADKTNMLYAGLENPISVSAAGYTPAQTFVKFSGGGRLIPLSPGHYKFIPDGSQTQVAATCFVKMSDGSTRQMGQPMTYKVRRVPRPEVILGTNKGPTISQAEASTVQQVSVAQGPDFIFNDLKYQVNSYTIGIISKRGNLIENVTGNKLPGDIKEKFRNLHVGDMIIVTNVACSRPGENLVLSGPTINVR
jgi:gliding motility-associated protein GldM